MSVEYLTPNDVRYIHDEAIRLYGGLPGEKEPGLIDFMASKPSQEYASTELYPGLFLKAAVYLEGFASRQFFHDGNKRTAYGCASTFLSLNGIQLNISDNVLFHLCKFIAETGEEGMTYDELGQWLERRSNPIEP